MKRKYAAHIVVALMKDPYLGGNFTVQENICLVNADNAEEAKSIAEIFAKKNYDIRDSSLEIEGQHGISLYLGIRKVSEVSYYHFDDNPGLSIDFEATFSEFVLDNFDEARKLAEGGRVDLTYIY